MPQSEIVSLLTKDNVKIKGNYYPGTSPRGVLLLHMMPADRTSWIPFAGKLQEAGFHAFAIDLRGHGSSQGGPDGYRRFLDEEHQLSIHDVEKAAEWLLQKNIEAFHLVGASIGANLALQYASGRPEAVVSIILLSPGLDYRGIKTEAMVRDLGSGQGAFFAASEEDMKSTGVSAAAMAKQLYDECPCRKEIKIFEGADHGTSLLDRHPEFMDELANWLHENPGEKFHRSFPGRR